MKKKLLIMMYSMGIGGVEKALLNFLAALDRERFEVTILFVKKNGEYLKDIPSWINIKEVKIPEFKRVMIRYGSKPALLKSIKKFNLFSMLKIGYYILIIKISSVIRNDRYAFYEVLGGNIPKINDHFDVALDFHGYTSFTTYYVSEKVDADVKATWLHSSKFDNGIRNFAYYYKKYYRVFGVSKACIDKFIDIFPEYKDKCDMFYNIIRNDDIKRLANIGQGFKDNFSGIRILTVGRLAAAKGYDVAVAVAKKLKEDGFNFRWYVVGDGIERLKIEKLIHDYHVEENFILLGFCENPYPYIKQCDIYVQTSRWEGYCTTITEAIVLNKPIITTDVSGVREQILNGETGIIVEFDENQIYNAIKNILTDTDLRAKIKENLLKEKNDTLKEMGKFNSLLEEK